jgi:Restriction endonuclease XhoI
MDGFCSLVEWLLLQNGLDEATIYVRSRREIPGYFRPTKDWDMIVVHERHLIAAVEFKSQKGSFGNNFNNRAEEAVGNATDLWTAFREGAYGKDRPRPWLGWVMLLEDCAGSGRPVKVAEPHFPVFPEFVGATYSQRYELLLRRLVQEKLYDSAAFITSTEKGGPRGEYKEPTTDLTMKRLLASFSGHVAGYLAAIK